MDQKIRSSYKIVKAKLASTGNGSQANYNPTAVSDLASEGFFNGPVSTSCNPEYAELLGFLAPFWDVCVDVFGEKVGLSGESYADSDRADSGIIVDSKEKELGASIQRKPSKVKDTVDETTIFEDGFQMVASSLKEVAQAMILSTSPAAPSSSSAEKCLEKMQAMIDANVKMLETQHSMMETTKVLIENHTTQQKQSQEVFMEFMSNIANKMK